MIKIKHISAKFINAERPDGFCENSGNATKFKSVFAAMKYLNECDEEDITDFTFFNDTDKDTKKSEAIIDEAIDTFDDLIAKVNDKSVENKKAHFKAINQELETRGRALIEKINKL